MVEPFFDTGFFIEPMQLKHIDLMLEAACYPSLWKYTISALETLDDVVKYVGKAVTKSEGGSQYPLVLLSQDEKKVIGSSRLYDISHQHKTASIGYSWILPEFQRQGLAKKLKIFLLEQAFERKNLNKVSLKTDVKNVASRKLAEDLGFSEEEILRKNMVAHDGRYQDTVVYGLLRREWKDIKTKVLYGKIS